MPILNYTTKVNADRTVAEIQQMLVKAGATRFMIEYNGGQPSALVFQLENRPFRLPCRYLSVLSTLQEDNVDLRYRTEEHALRVAWRILKDWVAAQLALIETEMVDTEEVFLPYLVINDRGETTYDLYMRNDRMLPMREG